jgi:hypothetical protein
METEIIWRKDSIDYNRIVERAMIYLLVKNIIPTFAWGWKYSGSPDSYKAPRASHQTTRFNDSDGMTLKQEERKWGRLEAWKKCNDCGGKFPASREYFHKDANGKYGYKAICRYCRNPVEAQRWRDKHSQLQ